MNENEEELLGVLLSLSEKGEVKYTTTQLRRMTHTRREQVYRDYELKQLDEVNEAVSDMIVIKFEELLKHWDIIKEDSDLTRKLQNRSLFMKDVKRIVSYFTPFLPYVGLIEGILVTSTEIVNKYKTKNESDPHTTEEGEEHDKTSENESEHTE